MKLINQDLINQLLQRAGSAARRRTNFNLHPALEDPVQRLLVAAKADTYFRPHRHETLWECALVIRGAFEVLVFDDAAGLREKVRLGTSGEALGLEIPAGTWHTWVPVDDGVFFEVKQGPYDPVHGTTFAPWAPPEGDAAVPAFLARLRSAAVGDRLGA
jgi:cupin fold WbuC family metalloprotein